MLTTDGSTDESGKTGAEVMRLLLEEDIVTRCERGEGWIAEIIPKLCRVG